MIFWWSFVLEIFMFVRLISWMIFIVLKEFSDECCGIIFVVNEFLFDDGEFIFLYLNEILKRLNFFWFFWWIYGRGMNVDDELIWVCVYVCRWWDMRRYKEVLNVFCLFVLVGEEERERFVLFLIFLLLIVEFIFRIN